MRTTIRAKVGQRQAERLNGLALRYGLSLEGFVSRLLAEVSMEIPEETLSEYNAPRALAASLKRGLADWKSGHVSAEL